MSKQAVRTEAAPAPFQGAPYNQAIVANGFVFVAGQLGLEPGATEVVAGGITPADRAGVREPAGDPRGGGLVARGGREDDRVPARPRRLRRHERGVREPHRRDAAGALDGRGRPAAGRGARRDRGDRARLSGPGGPPCWNRAGEGDRGLRALARPRRLPRRRRRPRRAARARVEGRRLPRPRGRRRGSAGGARAARPGRGAHVAGKPVGHAPLPARPRGRARSRRPGSSSRRSRRERSTGPGRHDFEIVVDPAASDRRRSRPPRLHDQRDRAPARRRRAGRPLRRPRRPRARGVLRTVSAHSFAEDPLRLVRGLRFVSQLGLEPDAATLAQMRESAARVAARLGRAHRRRPRRRRDGGALEAAARPGAAQGAAARCATPACSPRSCPSSRRRSGSTPHSTDHAMTRRRAHVRRRSGGGRRRDAAARPAGDAPPRSRQGAAGSRREPRRDVPRGSPTARCGGSATRPSSASASSGSSASTRSCSVEGDARRGPAAARRATARGSPSTCSTTGAPTCTAATRPPRSRRSSTALARFRAVVEQELASPHRLSRPRRRRHRPDRARLPRRGRSSASALRELLARGRRGAGAATGARRLLARAEELLQRVIRWDAPGALRRRLHDARGGRQHGPVRLAQPRQPGGRAGPDRREPPACLRRARRSTPSGSPLNRQRHTAIVHERGAGRAAPTSATRSGATSRACRCSRSPPTASRSRSSSRDGPPALAVVHAGWRGLADGVVGAAVAALGGTATRRDDRAVDRALLLRGRARGLRRGSTPT